LPAPGRALPTPGRRGLVERVPRNRHHPAVPGTGRAAGVRTAGARPERPARGVDRQRLRPEPPEGPLLHPDDLRGDPVDLLRDPRLHGGGMRMQAPAQDPRVTAGEPTRSRTWRWTAVTGVALL